MGNTLQLLQKGESISSNSLTVSEPQVQVLCAAAQGNQIP